MGKEKGDKEELEMKKMLTAVCFFCSYLFWPQWGRHKKV